MASGIDRSFIVPTRFIFLMWAVFSVQVYFQIDFTRFGIYPRTVTGAIGIFTAPFVHGSLSHIISNTFPILFLGTALYFLFDRIASRVFLQSYFATGLLVWLFARSSFHIGASGLVFALASFLVFFGVFRRDFRSLFISLLIILIYNGLFYGVLPTNDSVSWESHLYGALVGMVIAARYSKFKKVNS